MNIYKTTSILILTAMFISNTALAEKLADKLSKGVIAMSVEVKGCEVDINKYCPNLPPNSQKIVMCMTAYEDKLSASCKFGIAEAAMSMNMGAAAIEYSISACEADADKHCEYMVPGNGNIIRCLRRQESKVSKACVAALKKTGFWNIGAE